MLRYWLHEEKSETHISFHPGLAIFVDVQSIASQLNIFAKCSEMKCCAQTQEIEPRLGCALQLLSELRIIQGVRYPCSIFSGCFVSTDCIAVDYFSIITTATKICHVGAKPEYDI